MLKAIVVDNNPQELLKTAKQIMESNAFETVLKFEDPLKAVKYIEQHHCDVVFTEVEMKRMNGFDLVRRFGGWHPDIYIVFVTKERSYALQAFEYSVADFIVKPVDSKDICRVVRKLYNKAF
jgi:Response regulator of the LytR/AlgR family